MSHSVDKHLNVNGGQCVHSTRSEPAIQMLLDDTLRGGIRVCAPSWLFDGNVFPSELFKSGDRCDRSVRSATPFRQGDTRLQIGGRRFATPVWILTLRSPVQPEDRVSLK
jgi:hypothetical protein